MPCKSVYRYNQWLLDCGNIDSPCHETIELYRCHLSHYKLASLGCSADWFASLLLLRNHHLKQNKANMKEASMRKDSFCYG